jgi:hypothetical protein
VSVNPNLAKLLQDNADAGDTKAGKMANRLLSYDHLDSLFTNPDYEIDEEDVDFKLRNLSGVAATKRARRDKPIQNRIRSKGGSKEYLYV